MPVTVTHDSSIDYDVRGDGPYLLLINGLGFGRWGWFRQVPALSRRFRVVTFDVRGEPDLRRGVADLAAEAVALLDHLGARKAHVLGVSLGGFVAQELALTRPDLVDRLVLVGTSGGGGASESPSLSALGRMLGWGAMGSEDAVRRGLEAATSDAYRAEHPEEFERIAHWRLADAPSLSDYYRQAMAGVRFDTSRSAGEITAPTLIVHGAEDRYVPAGNAAALAEIIPDTRLRVLDRAGHLVFIERFAEVNRQTSAFLAPQRKRRQARETQAAPRTTKALAPGLGAWFRRTARTLGGWLRGLRERLPG